MSGASGAYPQKIKRKRYSTESGVMDRVLMTGSLGPMAQEAGRGDEGAGVYGGDVYDDDDDSSEEEEEGGGGGEACEEEEGTSCRFSVPRAGL